MNTERFCLSRNQHKSQADKNLKMYFEGLTECCTNVLNNGANQFIHFCLVFLE